MSETGVVFPAGPDGRRSTSLTGTAVWADAVRETDGELAARIEASRTWRKSYIARVVELTAAGTGTPAGAVAVAVAGLASLHHRLQFSRAGLQRPLKQALEVGGTELSSRAVTGGAGRVTELRVPYRGSELGGEALRDRLAAWTQAGVVELSFAEAIGRVIDHPQWLDLSDRCFALLGAGAELGPLAPLLSWGAQVLAVDIPAEPVQARLIALAEQGAGTMVVPVQGGQAGADLLDQTPEVARWLAATAPGLGLAVGSYGYADGARHLLVAAASDLVVGHLLTARQGTSYAELATPTDAYPVPMQIVDEARARWQRRGWRAPLQWAVPGCYAPSYDTTVTRHDGTVVGIADVLVPQQGPNYTLAKRVQRWRATVAQADGFQVSVNVAPPTTTRSVTKNRLLAAAYAGAGAFGVEVFAPETARVLMAALWVHDLHHQVSPAHPDEMFAQQAAHGGLWRVGYRPRSVLGLAALKGLPSALRHG